MSGITAKYKPYPAYRGSGIEWLGSVPEHWVVGQLGHYSHVQTGLTLGKTYDRDDLIARPYLRVANVQDGFVDLTEVTETQVPPSEASRHELLAGDVLMTEGGDFDKLGRGCVWSGEVTGCLHQNHVFAVRPDPRRLLPDFLAALTASATGRFYFTSTSQQSTNLATTSRTKVKALPIVLPPLPEQRAIVDFLDRETGRIDALIGKKRRLIELLEEKRSALISHAVTKGLDPDAPMKDSGIEWLGQIPAHWEVLCNRRLFSERVEANRPDLPILNVSIHTGVELRTFSESRIEQQCYDRTLYKVARRGDLAYNTMRMWQGAVGVAPVDGLVSPAYVVCGSTARVLPRYFELVYRTDYYRTEVNRYSYGIVPDRNRLYFERFAQMKAPVPPLSEQNHIVDSLSQQTGRMDQLVARNREAIDKLQEYRTALISAAVTGKIDVRREQV